MGKLSAEDRAALVDAIRTARILPATVDEIAEGNEEGHRKIRIARNDLWRIRVVDGLEIDD
ncbi:hypothetical protein [Rhodospira trueperi]|nr:hypothetical protein [Rhodospira trueperi]